MLLRFEVGLFCVFAAADVKVSLLLVDGPGWQRNVDQILSLFAAAMLHTGCSLYVTCDPSQRVECAVKVKGGSDWR